MVFRVDSIEQNQIYDRQTEESECKQENKQLQIVPRVLVNNMCLFQIVAEHWLKPEFWGITTMSNANKVKIFIQPEIGITK